MSSTAALIDRLPSIDEYLDLLNAVGWRPRDRAAVQIALRNSFHCVCIELDGRVIAMGRVIGDGALHFYLTDIVVHPADQRRGHGTRIVQALTKWLEAQPHKNIIAAILPTPGLAPFYAKHGYKPLGSESPIMQKWINAAND